MPRLSKIGAACLAAFGFSGGSAGVTASYLVVGGGGSGGSVSSNGNACAGGGGAGGFVTGTASLSLASTYTVTVGAGGSAVTGNAGTNANGNAGSNSVFGSFATANGGGFGGATLNNPSVGGNGASGGGGSPYGGASSAGGTGTQGNNGGASDTVYGAGGGGGASAVGGNGSSGASGAGGNGSASSISGSSVTYAGGGGGGGRSSFNGAAGGTGGGGAGGNNNAVGNNGSANLGAGGGGSGTGGGSSVLYSGGGGSGVVIVSYPGVQQFGGGVVSYDGTNTIHTFTTSGQLVPLNSLTASYLIVAGGGGGGANYAGGGGAGGMLTGSGLTIDTSSTYLVTVGGGGAGSPAVIAGNVGVSGSNSAFSIVSTSAIGGGGGAGQSSAAGANGGSGGGSCVSTSVSSGTSGQGNGGGQGATSANYGGGGGGGAGAAGSNGTTSAGGNGGVGLSSSISGTATYYAGGGGGGTYGTTSASIPAGSGGNGGGGAGGGNNQAGTSATPNTGGGGGGGNQYYTGSGFNTYAGGNGGSGVVVISYPGSVQQMAGGTVTIVGGNVIHTFTSSGYLTPLTYVGNSLRWRLSNSAYLSRTPTVAGNRKTWTWSAWVKRGSLTTFQFLLSTGTAGSTDASIYLTDSDRFKFEDRGTSTNLSGSAQYRDPAAWYHFVCAIDTTQATASNRVKLYVNGTQLTAFDGTVAYPAQNSDLAINNNTLHYDGRRSDGYYFDGYQTEVRFIDGQQLAPTAFGSFNAYGVWQPINYGGSYGTNGFYLPFSNTTSTTTLGYDFSPMGNNWATSGISVTAGATYDAMTDVPTLTSATAANYPVLNPLSKNYYAALSNANLTVYTASNDICYTASTIALTAGNKCYFELTCQTNTGSGFYQAVGIWATNQFTSYDAGNYTRYYMYNAGGNFYNGAAGNNPTYAATWTNGDVIGVAVDMTTGSMTFYKNGASQGVATTTINTALSYFVNVYTYTTQASVNFGQRPFAYTPPTGYVALNTYNM